MNLRECYEYMDGDYEEVLSHLRTEDRVEKFLYLFLSDDSYERLIRSLQIGDDDEAFRAVHTLKGICQNLSFTKLYGSSAALTEALRGGRKGDIIGLTECVQEDYRRTAEAIQMLRQGQGEKTKQEIRKQGEYDL